MRSVLFYPASLNELQLSRVVSSMVIGSPMMQLAGPPDPLNTIEFAHEAGDVATHAFAVTYDAGMDAIEVTDAALAFKVLSYPIAITGFTTAPFPGGGVSLTLKPKPGAAAAPARLRSVVLKCSNPPPLGDTMRLVVRPLNGTQAAPPLFSDPPITLGSGTGPLREPHRPSHQRFARPRQAATAPVWSR